jgi:hypothetical protein
MIQKKVTSKQLIDNANDIHLGGSSTALKITYRYLCRFLDQPFFRS